MAVKLRLRRMGKKRQPIYKIVAVDSRSPRDGAFIEAVGLYNPMTQPHTLEIDEAKAIKWLENGAVPTVTVKSLLKQKGVTLALELKKQGLTAEAIEVKLNEWRKAKGLEVVVKAEKKETETKGTAEVKGAASETTEETVVTEA